MQPVLRHMANGSAKKIVPWSKKKSTEIAIVQKNHVCLLKGNSGPIMVAAHAEYKQTLMHIQSTVACWPSRYLQTE